MGTLERRTAPARRLPERAVPGLVALLLLVAAGPLAAQAAATGGCVVSILNQTAFVRPDGSWTVPNVPSNMGPVRARMTCTSDGVTTSGASELFPIAQNRMNAIPPITIGAAPPVPARISVAPSALTLTVPGATVQLAVTATFADGASMDVSAASSGTVYATTNSRIVTVSADGLVTAVGSGRALVTILHEAILTSAAVDVSLGGDSDGDGIPDDLEVANGLDPGNPIDALEDADGDGLTNREELIDVGTDIRKADTDGDGLADGREVREVGTSPLLFDTDGDHVSDGLEVLAGSDPLDPASVDLGPILAAMSVAPGNFNLIFNTVIGEASRELAVTGTLIDGTSLDITAGPYGTTYASTDLTIASFGAQPGRVFAGQTGVATVTAHNGSRQASAIVHVSVFSPTALSSLALPAATYA